MEIDKYKTLEEKEKLFKKYVRINNFEEFDRWYGEIKSKGSLYRGIIEAGFKNYTSAQRFNIVNDYEDLPHQTQIRLELDEMRKYKGGLIERYCTSLGIPCTDLYLLSFAQHYGGISPLLDFTTDINTALFFMTDGCSFPKTGKGEDRCEAIDNYASLYYIENNRIMRGAHEIEAYNDYDVCSIGTVLKRESSRIPINELLSYNILSNFIVSGVNDAGPMPLLLENKPVTINGETDKQIVRLMLSNLNIEAQYGCFIFHDHYLQPLERGLSCVDIHKSLIPYIEQEILKPNDISTDTVYPTGKSIVSESFRKSLARKDIGKYYQL